MARPILTIEQIAKFILGQRLMRGAHREIGLFAFAGIRTGSPEGQELGEVFYGPDGGCRCRPLARAFEGVFEQHAHTDQSRLAGLTNVSIASSSRQAAVAVARSASRAH